MKMKSISQVYNIGNSQLKTYF